MKTLDCDSKGMNVQDNSEAEIPSSFSILKVIVRKGISFGVVIQNGRTNCILPEEEANSRSKLSKALLFESLVNVLSSLA